jgi:hypothetical protein
MNMKHLTSIWPRAETSARTQLADWLGPVYDHVDTIAVEGLFQIERHRTDSSGFFVSPR